jgi:hypothetical protein
MPIGLATYLHGFRSNPTQNLSAAVCYLLEVHIEFVANEPVEEHTLLARSSSGSAYDQLSSYGERSVQSYLRTVQKSWNSLRVTRRA